jgi:ABC-type branched-subunit amino acid transport system substrate-binding protein
MSGALRRRIVPPILAMMIGGTFARDGYADETLSNDTVKGRTAPPGEPPASPEPLSPYHDLSRSGAGFHGPGREDPPPPGLKSVRLGLIGPAGRSEGDRLRAGVALAVSEANERGGADGLPFEIVFRADDGPWGMGAKQVTALAYEDSTWVILGGLEGGDAHLAELIAAKLWIPVVTITAGDLSIDYANVPWVFRCFPSDVRQAELLLGWARDRSCRRVLVFSQGDREGRTGFRRIEAAARSLSLSLIGPREFAAHAPGDAVRPEDLRAADAVTIWGRSESGLALLEAVRGAGFGGPILLPAHLLSPELLAPNGALGEVIVAAPYELSGEDAAMAEFRERFLEETGQPADPVALFAYDAAGLVIAAIERAGLNRARIRDALADSDHDGVAGRIRFNALGGAVREPVLMRAQEGRWAPVRVEPEHLDQ